MCKGNYALSVKEKMFCGVPSDKDCKREIPSFLFTMCNIQGYGKKKGLTILEVRT